MTRYTVVPSDKTAVRISPSGPIVAAIPDNLNGGPTTVGIAGGGAGSSLPLAGPSAARAAVTRPDDPNTKGLRRKVGALVLRSSFSRSVSVKASSVFDEAAGRAVRGVGRVCSRATGGDSSEAASHPIVRHAAPDRATVFGAIKGITILSSRRAHDDIRAQIAATRTAC